MNNFDDSMDNAHFVPAPCQVACPIGTDAPSYIGYIWEENFEGALEAITETNPFSAVCGRVCDAPCEPACRRVDSDGAVAIRNLKRFVMDRLGPGFHLPPVPVTKDESIGIIGAGPAGMTAAHDLALAGYTVHLYEMTDRLGGLMIWGIPAFRMPPHVIKEDIDRILGQCPGIEPHLNCELGEEITIDQLKEKHDAVLLTIGAWWGKRMGIAGDDHDKVIDGVSFLRDINDGARPKMPETVLVVGGGDVAMDACRVAKRLPGCKDVKVIYRRGPDEIPARRDELEGAIKEDIEFVYFSQPVGVRDDGDGVALECVTTELGEPEEDGRRRPVAVAGSEHLIHGGLIIAAVGQKTECTELDERQMMNGEKIDTSWDSMRTSDAKVFGAGDGAFGPSTIVQAMFHGHRAAYYIQAFLNGDDSPAPYQTPYRTRRVPVSQDDRWELAPRQEQPFHGLGKEPVKFAEIESGYTLEEAKCEAARCYRCDCENGTQEYSVANREDIFVMARIKPGDHTRARQVLKKRLETRPNLLDIRRPAMLDDIHFLPANLSRLVIDPYREACSTVTTLGGITLESPFIVTGFDTAPDTARRGLAAAVEEKGAVYLGAAPLTDGAPWIQLAAVGDTIDSAALGVVHDMTAAVATPAVMRARDDQMLGVVASAATLAEAIPFALDNDCHMLMLDGTDGVGRPWPELQDAFDLTVLRDAVRLLRERKSEELIVLAYLGGVRSGTDAAKVIAMGCDVAAINIAVALALGATFDNGSVTFPADLSEDEYAHGAGNFLQACTGEVSMMARCAGKTNIHSLEPEDLRTITIATAEALGVDLAGT